ncbi:hypothetical protein KKB06_03330 [Patescibacteria group bacterium]|nr:hypothetical protein [Patescibacteria group bacterium]
MKLPFNLTKKGYELSEILVRNLWHSIKNLFIILIIIFSFTSPSFIHAQDDTSGADDVMTNQEEIQSHIGSNSWAVPKAAYEETLETSRSESHESFSARSFLYSLYPLSIGIYGSEQLAQAPGAIHLAGGLVSQIITQPPSSSVEYLADLGSRIGLVKPAYAQDSTGYRGLFGVLETWKIFRNISYALFVIIFVVVGFMIMFRSKLNPQTVVSLQLALPKLIVTLLLITFSYAIAGFVIDLIYLITYLAANILDAEAADYMTTGLGELINIFKPWESADTIADSLSGLFPKNTGLDVLTEIATIEIFSVSLMKVIVGGAILFSILKLLIQLILAYVNIILQVIFAPIMLLFNALPQSNSFSSWIKNLIANAAAFPAVAIMIMVGDKLINSDTGIGTDSLQLPFIGFLAGSQNFVQVIIGFGFILILPKIVTMIQEALKVKPAMPAGAAVIEGIGAATAPISGAFKARRETIQRRRESQAQATQIGKAVNS